MVIDLLYGDNEKTVKAFDDLDKAKKDFIHEIRSLFAVKNKEAE